MTPDALVRISAAVIAPAKFQQAVQSWILQDRESLRLDGELFCSRFTNHIQAGLAILRDLVAEDGVEVGNCRCLL